MIGTAAKLSGAAMRQPSAREIAAILRDEIRSGEHQPGDQLLYSQIAERFGGISMSTVQRVMGRLEAMDLVEFGPGRGWFVRSQESPEPQE